MEDYFEQICAWMRLWHALFVMCTVVMVLIVTSAIITPRGTAAYFVNLLNIAIIVPMTAGLLYVIVKCNRRNR
ncbi:hypothetical protein [Halosimplex amylolyticum]|uniref:hypothetical protein n=1 Tax=Halosimplex amylolyticum TaxID=3396616 RepID=UPI003F57B51C